MNRTNPIQQLARECNWPRLWIAAVALASLALIIIAINNPNP